MRGSRSRGGGDGGGGAVSAYSAHASRAAATDRNPTRRVPSGDDVPFTMRTQ